MKLIFISLSVIVLCASTLPKQDEALVKSIERGKTIYTENCITCHMGAGEGVPATFPPLSKADFLIKNPEKAIEAVKFGMQEKIVVNGAAYEGAMPNPGLDNEEIADVLNYVQNAWGNTSHNKMITAKMVEAVQQKK
ncbi:MAG: cytochrome c [Spirosomataceae bacterium]